MVRLVNINDTKTHALWRDLFHHLKELVLRVWTFTKAVMSLAPARPDGSEGIGAESRPDHEIARAAEYLSGHSEGDDGMDPETTRLLSDCWRATKQARCVPKPPSSAMGTMLTWTSELLAALATVPLHQSGSQQRIWDAAELDAIGLQFLEWMHDIRHRGTFSRVALALGSVVEAVKAHESLKPLASNWLDVGALSGVWTHQLIDLAGARCDRKRLDFDHAPISRSALQRVGHCCW